MRKLDRLKVARRTAYCMLTFLLLLGVAVGQPIDRKNLATEVKAEFLHAWNGYKQYWDTAAMAPYLFNSETNVFISYDRERSVEEKCKYVKKTRLAGAMFWEYNSDKKEYLLKIIADNFKYKKKNK